MSDQQTPKPFIPADPDLLDDQIAEDDQTCTVCGVFEASDEDPIVYCDGCQVAVHCSCYGIRADELEADSWYCRPCRNKDNARLPGGKPNEKRRCKICSHLGGALSELTQPRTYCHTCCALYLPEVTFSQGCVELHSISRKRSMQQCSYCDQKSGATVVCSYIGCRKALHLHCGVRNRFMLEALPSPQLEKEQFFAYYCDSHTPMVAQCPEDEKYVVNFDHDLKVFRKTSELLEQHPLALLIKDIPALKIAARQGTLSKPVPHGQYQNPRLALSECFKGARQTTSARNTRVSSNMSSYLTQDEIDRELGSDPDSESESNAKRRDRKTKKRRNTDDEERYFDDDDAEDGSANDFDEEVIDAEGNPIKKKRSGSGKSRQSRNTNNYGTPPRYNRQVFMPQGTPLPGQPSQYPAQREPTYVPRLSASDPAYRSPSNMRDTQISFPVLGNEAANYTFPPGNIPWNYPTMNSQNPNVPKTIGIAPPIPMARQAHTLSAAVPSFMPTPQQVHTEVQTAGRADGFKAAWESDGEN
ncbi:putative Fanconi anemia group M protein [Blattamonas nauphoetae]|uniref:Fanconi anemia group M protein n=1 Tax=Blattamonas nauphoetae TaxID=2049346 RepID=A0ABQ9YBA4_9EUKA|nr:putative Fanconi anemia group M protein [Blattamonas nauphoetae]